MPGFKTGGGLFGLCHLLGHKSFPVPDGVPSSQAGGHGTPARLKTGIGAGSVRHHLTSTGWVEAMAGRLSWRKSGKRCAAAKAAGFAGRRKPWKLSQRPAFEAGADKAAGPTPMAGYLRDSCFFMRYELY